ncbi:alpha-galactosidase A [Xylaria sp. FL0933]|nr:alpha-galactosidase A [Xylaria sp. FL0933]
MSDDHTTNPPMQPIILSMEVDDDDSFESEYRLQIGNQVNYLVISSGTFDRDTLSFPLLSLPRLPYNEEWTVAHISRDKTSGDLKTSISNRTLAGPVSNGSCLASNKKRERISYLRVTDWPHAFLAHVHENGRIVGFLLEKIEGRSASSQDLSVCETALRKLYELGLVHGDVNRYNFLVTEEGVKLLDFERLRENASPESMSKELESLRAELVDESGRGGGFIFHGDSN